MRRVFLSLAALTASLAAAAPALANEARVEARGGVFWVPDADYSEATAGIALGYDFDLGDTVFVGMEGSADKILASGTEIYWGLTGRAGVKASANDKLFATGGYTVGEGPDSPHLGAGWEHNFGPLYGKVEYRHFFTEGGLPDSNAVVGGIGVKF